MNHAKGMMQTPRHWSLQPDAPSDAERPETKAPPSAGNSPLTLVAGGAHSLALRADGTVWGWGSNGNGQLGAGAAPLCWTPVQVAGLAGVTALAAGAYHSLALRSGGTVWSWGYNAHGQLGEGTNTDRATPVQVPGLTGVIALATGGVHTLALRGDGSVWAWGQNSRGQLGDGTTASRALPRRWRCAGMAPPGPGATAGLE